LEKFVVIMSFFIPEILLYPRIREKIKNFLTETLDNYAFTSISSHNIFYLKVYFTKTISFVDVKVFPPFKGFADNL
jgi:hypothetical protein